MQLEQWLAEASRERLPALKEKIDAWKPARQKTVDALEELAGKCDYNYKKSNGVKLGSAVVSGLSAIGGVALIVFSAGVATPMVVAGGIGLTAAGIAGGVGVVWSDYDISASDDKSKSEAEEICRGEMDSYESVIEQLKSVGRKFHEKYSVEDWPDFGHQVATTLGLNTADAASNKFLVALVLTDNHREFESAVEGAEQVAKAADSAAATAEKAATLAKEAGYATEAATTLEKAREAREAAEEARQAKDAWKTRAVITAVKKASGAAAAAAKAASSVVELSATRWFAWFASSAKSIAKEAEVATIAAERAVDLARPLAKGAKVLGKVVVALTPVFLLLDIVDVTQAGIALREGESPAGNFVRRKAQELREETEQVDRLYAALLQGTDVKLH